MGESLLGIWVALSGSPQPGALLYPSGNPRDPLCAPSAEARPFWDSCLQPSYAAHYRGDLGQVT